MTDYNEDIEVPDDASGIIEPTETVDLDPSEYPLMYAISNLCAVAEKPCAVLVFIPTDDPDDPEVYLRIDPRAYPDAQQLCDHLAASGQTILMRQGEINKNSAEILNNIDSGDNE